METPFRHDFLRLYGALSVYPPHACMWGIHRQSAIQTEEIMTERCLQIEEIDYITPKFYTGTFRLHNLRHWTSDLWFPVCFLFSVCFGGKGVPRFSPGFGSFSTFLTSLRLRASNWADAYMRFTRYTCAGPACRRPLSGRGPDDPSSAQHMTRPGLEPAISGSGGRRLIH